MDLTIQHLRSFVAVAEDLNFTKAAERLRITTPALSQQLATTERRIGVALFTRTSRKVTLTTAGAELLPIARKAIAAMDRVNDWAVDQAALAPLRIGVPDSWSIVSEVLVAFTDAQPDAAVVLQRTGFSEGVAAVREGRVDVAFLPALQEPKGAGVNAVPLWSEQRLLVVGVRHPLAFRRSVAIAETSTERFVSFADPSVIPDWYVIPRPDGSVPRIDPIADSYDGILDLCAAGLAVHIVGTVGAASHARADLAYVPIIDAGDSTTWLITPRRNAHRQTRAFIQTATAVVRQLAPTLGIRPH